MATDGDRDDLEARPALPGEDDWHATQAAELRALRARLRAVEAALGLPVPPGHRAPPSLPEVARRLALLERQAGVVPGLAPLPGLVATGAPGVADPPAAPRTLRQVWGERSQAALAAMLLVALAVWLLRPGGTGGRASGPASAGPPATVAQATLVPRAVPALPCAGASGGGCAGAVHANATPDGSPGEASCALGLIGPCVVQDAPVPPGAWGRDETCDAPAARVCSPRPAPPNVCSPASKAEIDACLWP